MLEKEAGLFSSLMAKNLPKNLQQIAFCLPTSFRCAEDEKIWHPFWSTHPFLYVLTNLHLFLRPFLGGIRRFIFLRLGKITFINEAYLPGQSVLVLSPEFLLKMNDKKMFETTYLQREENHPYSWLIFHDGAQERSYPIKRKNLFFMQMQFLWAVIKTFLESKNHAIKLSHSLIFSYMNLKWLAGLYWAHLFLLQKKIEEVFNQYHFKIVHATHEMHPHSRILWFEARKQNIPSSTMQHASITRSKLWYFPTPEELASGLKIPDYFGVFSAETKFILEKYYQNQTEFSPYCGPRFSHWKTCAHHLHDHSEKVNKNILFVTALPCWDVDIVVNSLLKLASTKPSQYNLVLRLHPQSQISWISSLKIKYLIKKYHLILSRRDLQEDLQASAIVVGVSSTVLQECLLLGKLSLSIKDDHYLIDCLGLHAISMPDLNWSLIEKYIVHSLNIVNNLRATGINLLGLNNNVFSLD